MNALDAYQADAARTLAPAADADKQLAVMGLGLAGEAGEVIEMIKKAVGHGHTLDNERLRKELGDVLWYLAAIATLTHSSLADIAEVNVAKLRARYPEGFTHEASRMRAEGDV